MTEIFKRGCSLKVLNVAETAKGGIATYLDELIATQISMYGQDAIRVITPKSHSGEFERIPKSLQITFRDFRKRIVNMLSMVMKTLVTVGSWKPDIVHLHSTYAGFALRPLLALMLHRPVVVYCPHGWAFDRESRNMMAILLEWVERVWSCLCDSVICISEHERLAGMRIGIPGKKLTLIYNGISDLSDFNPSRVAWPDECVRVLFVGRFDRQKGIDILYAAMQRLGRRAFAFAIGSPVLNDCSIPNPPGNVSLTGWLPRNRITDYYASADVLVVPSRWEGFGLTAVEAMRAGTAVIASSVGGLSEIVQDGVTGRLVPPGEADKLAKAIEDLSPEKFINMGQSGRARFIEMFHIERMCSEIDGLYRSLLSNN